jgi:hypothetical protein
MSHMFGKMGDVISNNEDTTTGMANASSYCCYCKVHLTTFAQPQHSVFQPSWA